MRNQTPVVIRLISGWYLSKIYKIIFIISDWYWQKYIYNTYNTNIIFFIWLKWYLRYLDDIWLKRYLCVFFHSHDERSFPSFHWLGLSPDSQLECQQLGLSQLLGNIFCTNVSSKILYLHQRFSWLVTGRRDDVSVYWPGLVSCPLKLSVPGLPLTISMKTSTQQVLLHSSSPLSSSSPNSNIPIKYHFSTQFLFIERYRHWGWVYYKDTKY